MPETAELRALTEALNIITPQVPLLEARMAAEERELIEVKAEQRGLRLWARRLVIAIVAGIIATGLIFTAFLVQVQKQSLDNEKAIEANNLRWCPLLLGIGPRPGAPPPAGNAEQQKYARDTRRLISDLAVAYHCK